MVDVPPSQNFIVVVTFLGIFATLLVAMPSGLLETEFTGKQGIYAEEYWGLSDLEQLATFHNITADNGGSYYYESWGIDEGFGHNFDYIITDYGGDVGEAMVNKHFFIWVIFAVEHHNMEWTEKTNGTSYGEVLTLVEFEEAAVFDSDTDITSASYTLTCDHVTLHSVVAYNGTAYSNSSIAWAADALTVEFAIDWDELGTGLNAWNLLAQILFFQAPDIHPVLNAFIAIPLWAAIGYLAYALIMVAISVLPFT